MVAKIPVLITFLMAFVANSRRGGLVIGDSLELVAQRNVAFLRSSAGCSVPIDFDRALYQHLRYAFSQRNILVAHLEVNFDYYTINKRYHLILMPDSRGVTAFAHRQKFRRNSLIPQSYYYEHVTTSVARPISDICRNSYDRDQAVQEAIFTSMVDAAITGLLPYESIVGSTVCFTRNVNADIRTRSEDVIAMPNSQFYCCRAGEYFETCTKSNRTVDDVVEVKGHSVFLYLLYAIVYCYVLPLVIAWVLCDVNCLEDGRTLSYVVNPKTVYFGYAQLGFPPIIKKVIFVLLGISGYALIAIIALTSRSPTDQLWFIICFLLLSVILMFSAKRIVLSDSLRPADKYVLGFVQISGDSPQQKMVLSSTLGPKTDLLLQQQESLIGDHPDITVYPSISSCSRLLFMSKYWHRYCKVLRRICSERPTLIAFLPVITPSLLIAFVLNTVPLVQLIVFVIYQIRGLMILHANGISTMVIYVSSMILFVGYVALLLYVPCVIILCLYYTVLSILQSVHLLMIGLAFVIVVYQLGIFICQESEKFTYMTECVVRLNLVYLRYEGAAHRAPCCEQLVRSVPLNPNHVQINSIFFDSLVKAFFPMSHSIKTICFRGGLFLFVCSFLFAVFVQCGATNFFVNQTISFNILVAVLVPKFVFSLWPFCTTSNLLLPSPSMEQAIYIFIDDWYRKNCQTTQKPSPAILKIGPGLEYLESKMTPQLGARDIVIANMMDQMAPYSENYYGTITTAKFSGPGSGGSPLTNYGDLTMGESGRYTMTSSSGQGHCQGGTLPSSIRHHNNISGGSLVPTNAMSNSMIKHAVFATKPHMPTSSTGDTASEVDSILYYNDIISKHPSERTPVATNYLTNNRIYGNKNLLDVKANGDMISENSCSTDDSPLAGPGSPSSYSGNEGNNTNISSNNNNVRITIPPQQPSNNNQQQQHHQQRAGLATVRSQSETDESSL